MSIKLPRETKEIQLVTMGDGRTAIVLAERLGHTFAVKCAIVLKVIGAEATGEALTRLAEACRDATGAERVVWNREAEGLKELL